MQYNDIIDTFLSQKSELPKLVVVYWPTASWKTSLSLDIAQYLKTEIISTDSRQIYTGMNIGTGKITPLEAGKIPHHMIDIIPPDNDSYSVWEFKTQAEQIIGQLHKKWKIPILCGWTGLYIDSIIYDFNIPKIPADPLLRKQLEAETEKHGPEYIYNKLQDIDPEYAKQVHPHNTNYVIRWIEVKTLSGKSKCDFVNKKILKYDVLFLCPSLSSNPPPSSGHLPPIKEEETKWKYREILYERINTRVQQMFDEWLVWEVEVLLKKYGKIKILTDTIGYSEVIDYLEQKIPLSECVALVQQHNRNYAKRQLTWFRKYQ